MIDSFQHAHNPEIERAVLAVILSGRAKDAFSRLLDASPGPIVFWKRDYRLIAMTMARIAQDGRETDCLSVIEAASQISFNDAIKALKAIDEDATAKPDPHGDIDHQDSLLAAIGGANTILDLTASHASAGGFDKNVAALVAYHHQRKLIASLESLATDARAVGGATKAQAIADRTVNEIAGLMGTGQGALGIADFAEVVLADHDAAARSGDDRAASWGIDALDNACRMSMGQIIILAARPGCGKTSLMLQAAQSTTKSLGAESVALVTLEMPGQDLARILIGRQIGVGQQMIQRGWMTDEQRSYFQQAIIGWRANDIPVKGQGDRCTVDDVCAWVRSRHRRSNGKLALVGIDYLQLIDGTNPKHNENDRIGYISRRLKVLSVQLRIAILVLCQMNRESVKDKREPELYDLRGSGTIEQDADSVVFLYGSDEESSVTQITAKVAKQRRGPKGATGLEFLRGHGQTFREVGQRPANGKMFAEPQSDEDVLNHAF